MASSTAEQAPVKLLAIDGGGVRGLSALVLLEQVIDISNKEREKRNLPPQEPWEMFDMIGGTSTGGLIAVMLGRLRMSIKDCKAAYENLAQRAFTEKNFIGRVKGTVTVGPQFETQPLEDAIKSIIGDEWETMLFNEVNIGCRVLETMHIWQACRATSAALTYFKPIKVDGNTYSDGGLLYNNPVQLLHSEASEVFEGRDQLIVSVGTGLEKIMKWQPSLATVAEDLARLATETERTADDFYRRNGAEAAKAGRYFRFNVPGLGDIGLEESGQLRHIKRLTDRYINQAEVGYKVDSCAKQLTQGVCALLDVPTPLQDLPNKDSRSRANDLEERLQKLKES
ncbi:acyl transferase/acyl hydrolase/lysophospholipase [Penicillium macrosclerotiorum]|uniref:acyl transferase/acyl hydrolase/lysophospholipase n=1 Tax=Penicillium macrosclerotiorum TaxID=303699 RepID=UPI0025479FA8|nr:acyl transferase/acyl hydrolase/lysophospholipase [Penicillium macrosclerotiorum]KAJ5669542.1 acyl transferase/acyl hydrolase/lysophospholipase [Penicillium macrosclerotiorum]